MRALLLFVAVVGVVACNSPGGPSGANPDAATIVAPDGGNGRACVAGSDPKCGVTCKTDDDCGAALFCSPLGHCSADCILAQLQCASGLQCVAHGKCVPAVGLDAGGECPRINVTATNQVPTVLLLIDQSGSMGSNEFSKGVTRWQAVLNALIDPTNGVVYKVQSKVKFAVTMYTSHNGTAGGTCPILTPPDLAKQPPALNNADAIAKLLKASKPDTDTPTGDSINALIPKLEAYLPLEGSGGPVAILLATDGEPDSCAIPNPDSNKPAEQAQTNALAVDAATAAWGKGIGTIILSVGNQVGAAHLQAMANAGAGVTSGAKYYVANDPAALADSFDQIIRGVRNCLFKLSGTVADGKDSEGEVKLNGTTLKYNDPNGWKLKDSSTLELLGDACNTFKTSDPVSLEASFPCGSVIIN